jgi:ADP-ribosylglycohydrolase
MSKNTLSSIRNSALWAAYGDALGFITELADSKSLQWRVKAPRVTQTVSWRRMIGGRFGVEATLHAGCYSDDTQLRIATSRAIRGDGRFDVEAFAKVELPVWLAYALGAGRGTKLAAASLRSPDVAWFSNFFEKSKSRYIDCGGNGAAMRIQPHVWAAKDRSKPKSYILDVIRNAVCTHGHERGIFGAVFHAICLANTMDTGKVAGPDIWKEAVESFRIVLPLIRPDSNLGAIWLSVWEERSGRSFETAVDEVRDECLRDIEIATQFASEKSDSSYARMVEALGGLSENERGSGTRSAIIAAALSWIHKSDYPATALVKAANLLGSDSDTIATMAGAILGAVSNEPPRGPVLDADYIESEASRLHRISEGQHAESFAYPDLFGWHAPRTQLDAIGRVNGTFALAGLAKATELGPPLKGIKKDDAIWQWLRLEIGQSVFAKRREKPKPLPESDLPLSQNLDLDHYHPKSVPVYKTLGEIPEQRSLLEDRVPGSHNHETDLEGIDKLTSEAIRQGFDEKLIGKHLLLLAQRPDGIERAIAYVSIIVKARKARHSPHEANRVTTHR